MLSAILVYGGALVALGALVWSLFVAASRSPDEAASALTSGSEGLEPFEPPPDAVVSARVAGVRDADFLDGFWFVLDRYSSEVHRVDAQGVHLGSFAGEGEGPGELRSPRAVTVHADTIVVAARRGVHLYEPDGSSISHRRIEPPRDCPGAAVQDVASSRSGLLLLFTCRDGSKLEALVVFETGGAAHQFLAARSAGPDDERVWTAFREMYVLAAHSQGFLFGHPNDDCLEVFDLDGQVADSVCHRWIERHPVNEEHIEGWDELRASMRTMGVTLQRPESYPPFDKVFVREDAGPVYRTPTPGRVDLSRLLGREEERELVFEIPPAPAVFLAGTSVLAAWYDPSGTRIRVYDLAGG